MYLTKFFNSLAINSSIKICITVSNVVKIKKMTEGDLMMKQAGRDNKTKFNISSTCNKNINKNLDGNRYKYKHHILI